MYDEPRHGGLEDQVGIKRDDLPPVGTQLVHMKTTVLWRVSGARWNATDGLWMVLIQKPKKQARVAESTVLIKAGILETEEWLELEG